MATHRILLVDDEASSRHALGAVLRQAGYEVRLAANAFEALKLVEEYPPDVTLSDLMMPGMSGIELLRALRERDADAQLILVSGFRDVETAVDAVREGAFHYVCKPVEVDRLLRTVEKALQVRCLRAQAGSQFPPAAQPCLLVGESRELKQVLRSVAQVAPSKATVLITGESGTGKELVVEALHTASPRAQRPLVRLNCAALSQSLLESELFGHERGAFTGADRQRKGRIEEAHGGTLFLDEIGELPPSTQVKLLRFLQERVFERVGGNQPIQVDVRVIAATNRNLRDLVAAGSFREDLFYRLNVIELKLPPLRERPSDIPLLAMTFLRKHALANARPARAFDDAALSALLHHSWPGNVRELQNAIERAVVLANGDVVELAHLPPALQGTLASASPSVPGASMAEVERHVILSTLQANGGSTLKAARTLGISVRKIQYRIRQYGRSCPAQALVRGQSAEPDEAESTRRASA